MMTIVRLMAALQQALEVELHASLMSSYAGGVSIVCNRGLAATVVRLFATLQRVSELKSQVSGVEIFSMINT